MWKPYKNVSEALMPQAEVVADRFHVMKQQYFGQFLKRDTIAIKQRSKKSECNQNPKQTEKKALF
jgi:transposase